MNLKLASLATPLLLACVHLSEAQQPAQIPRIGVLTLGSGSAGPNVQAFRDKLRELGYVEGQNIVFEFREADGNADRLPELAEDLVRRQVSIIVMTSTASVLAASKSTSKIPIIAGSSGDLVGTV
jgi:putative tryptophan/tyrosine transport system substrate-binding protein